MRAILIWGVFLIATAVPILAAANSPLLAFRDVPYIAAGFSGVIAMSLLLVQPILAAGFLPGVPRSKGRYMHRWTGIALVLAVVLHVAGLWITSPPDVIDALLFTSPTPFSAWGVLAMWAVFAAALLAILRRRVRVSPRIWRRAHTSLAAVVVLGSVVHALLIEGTMETISKTVLCLLVFGAMLAALVQLRVWSWRRTGG